MDPLVAGPIMVTGFSAFSFFAGYAVFPHVWRLFNGKTYAQMEQVRMDNTQFMRMFWSCVSLLLFFPSRCSHSWLSFSPSVLRLLAHACWGTQRDDDFRQRIAKHRAAVEKQSDDYYGDKIKTLADYKKWLKDQLAARKQKAALLAKQAEVAKAEEAAGSAATKPAQ
jgi:hypothetical protein